MVERGQESVQYGWSVENLGEKNKKMRKDLDICYYGFW